MTRPTLMRTPQQLANDYAAAYGRATPTFTGWPSGIGWQRLCQWLSLQPDFAYHSGHELRDDCDQVARLCNDLLRADYDEFKILFPDTKHPDRKVAKTYPW